jgi:DNA polymerase III epsilon subunit-like protein
MLNWKGEKEEIMIAIPETYVVLDLETTDLKVDQARILEIGLLEVSPDCLNLPKSILVQYAGEVPEVVTRVTGISTDMVQGPEAIPLKDALDLVLETIGTKSIVVGHNLVKYDVPILKREASRSKSKLGPVLYDERLRDTAGIYKSWRLGIWPVKGESHVDFTKRVLDIRMRGFKFNLGHCCSELGILTDNLGDAHRAAVDVQMTGLVVEALRQAGALDRGK